MATEENQITVTGTEEPNVHKYELRASSVTGKYQPDKKDLNGKGKSRDQEGGMEGFGGIIGIGQLKKPGSMSV